MIHLLRRCHNIIAKKSLKKRVPHRKTLFLRINKLCAVGLSMRTTRLSLLIKLCNKLTCQLGGQLHVFAGF